MSRSPSFSRHALQRARQRFPWLRSYKDGRLCSRLERALLGGEIVEEEPEGGPVIVNGKVVEWEGSIESETVTIRGDLAPGSPAEFVVAVGSGAVLTVVDPLCF